MSQFVRLGLVLGFAAVVALTAVLSTLVLRAGRGGVLTKVAARVSYALLALAVLAFGYARFVEADWLEVTHHTVTTKKWARGHTLRIAQVSDLHFDGQSRALSELTEALRREKPDLLVFTGDAINTRESAPLFRKLFATFPARLGRFAVRGNHDVYRWSDVDLFGGGVATELFSDQPVSLENGALALCGAPFNGLDGVEGCLQKAPPGAFVLFAYHTPDLVEALPHAPDLYLAGHTHGGQVALPFYGAIITFSRFDKKYEAGRYQRGATTLYVNRGVGFEPGFPKVRFFARPELAIIEVAGE